jgi:hypothetical protein
MKIFIISRNEDVYEEYSKFNSQKLHSYGVLTLSGYEEQHVWGQLSMCIKFCLVNLWRKKSFGSSGCTTIVLYHTISYCAMLS